MKKISFTLFFVLFLSANIFGQESIAIEAEESLKAITLKLNTLDKSVSKPLYSDFSLSSEYNSLLSKVKRILTELETTKQIFENLAEKNKNEPDNYVKIAYCDLAFLSIYHERNQYLNAFRADPEFEVTLEEWEQNEFKHINSAKKNIGKIKRLDSKNIDIKIISAILLYYENDIQESLRELKKVLKDLTIQEKEIVAIENIDYASYIGFVNSWIAYLYVELKDFDNAKIFLENTKAANVPEANMNWAYTTEKKIKNVQKKNIETEIIPVNIPQKIPQKTYKELLINTDYSGKIEGIQFVEQKYKLNVNPEELVNSVIVGWQYLADFESEVWDKAEAAFNINAISSSTIYPKSVQREKTLLKIDHKNKGIDDFNRKNHFNYLKKIIDIYTYFLYLNDSWSLLIKENPEISYYRYYRIKTNIALNYILGNKDYSLIILQVTAGKIDPSILEDTKNYLNFDPLKQIETDIRYMQLNNPDDKLLTMSLVEVSVFTKSPNEALSTLAKYQSALSNTEILTFNDDENSTVSNLSSILKGGNTGSRNNTYSKAGIYIPIYKSYLFFKQRDFNKLEDEAKNLQIEPEFETWLDNVTNREEYLKKQTKINNKFNK